MLHAGPGRIDGCNEPSAGGGVTVLDPAEGRALFSAAAGGMLRSDRSDLGELLDCKLVAPATGGVPRDERLLGDVVCAIAEISGVMR